MLTVIDCKNASCPPDKKRARYADSGGLYLQVVPSGAKHWYWKYYFSQKEKRLALGRFPAVGLKEAREARDGARKVLNSGTDPSQKRQMDRMVAKFDAAASFEVVARELHSTKKASWSQSYADKWLRRLEKDVFPWLGKFALPAISAPVILQTLRRVEARGVRELAHSLLESIGQIFRYGVATGRCERNPAGDLRGALKPVITKNMAAVIEPKGLTALLIAIDGYGGQPTTRAALQLSALLFQRPSNIRMMEWAELRLDEPALWEIPSIKMKRTKQEKLSGRPHLVPLPPQAVEVLTQIYPLTGDGRYVFPSARSKLRPMSENAVRVALRTMGFDNDTMTPHGFRATARTAIVEQLGIHPDVIEVQLAHVKSGPLGSAYDRAEFMAQRRRMMIEWANYLDRLRQGGGSHVAPDIRELQGTHTLNSH